MINHETLLIVTRYGFFSYAVVVSFLCITRDLFAPLNLNHQLSIVFLDSDKCDETYAKSTFIKV